MDHCNFHTHIHTYIHTHIHTYTHKRMDAAKVAAEKERSRDEMMSMAQLVQQLQGVHRELTESNKLLHKENRWLRNRNDDLQRSLKKEATSRIDAVEYGNELMFKILNLDDSVEEGKKVISEQAGEMMRLRREVAQSLEKYEAEDSRLRGVLLVKTEEIRDLRLLNKTQSDELSLAREAAHEATQELHAVTLNESRLQQKYTKWKKKHADVQEKHTDLLTHHGELMTRVKEAYAASHRHFELNIYDQQLSSIDMQAYVNIEQQKVAFELVYWQKRQEMETFEVTQLGLKIKSMELDWLLNRRHRAAKEKEESRRQQQYQEQKQEFDDARRALEECKGIALAWQKHRKVKLNVGGVFYEVSIDTLCRVPDSMLRVMFARWMSATFQQMDEKGSDTAIFLDRDGDLFKYLLAYLRSYNNSTFDINILGQACDHLSLTEVYQLKKEFDYFGIDVYKPHAGSRLQPDSDNYFDWFMKNSRDRRSRKLKISDTWSWVSSISDATGRDVEIIHIDA